MHVSLNYPCKSMMIIPGLRLESEGQQDLTMCAVSIDPEYNILWSYSSESNKISCFNPIASNVEGTT